MWSAESCGCGYLRNKPILREVNVKLENKEALISGGATGIGRATAELFAREGACVHIIDYNEEEGQAAVAEIEAAGGSVREV